MATLAELVRGLRFFRIYYLLPVGGSGISSIDVWALNEEDARGLARLWCNAEPLRVVPGPVAPATADREEARAS